MRSLCSPTPATISMNCTMENLFGARNEDMNNRYLTKANGSKRIDGPNFSTRMHMSRSSTHLRTFDADGAEAQATCTHMAPETVVARWIKRGGDTFTGGGGVLFGGGPLPGGESPMN